MAEADRVAELVRDFKARSWKSEPMDRALEIALGSPWDLPRLVLLVIAEIPSGGTFLDAVLSFLDMDAWPAVAQAALDVLARNPESHAAQSVLEYAGLQCPSALRPHLEEIFPLALASDSYRAQILPWRHSGLSNFLFLRSILDDATQDSGALTMAWRAMIATGHPEAIAYALARSEQAGLRHQAEAYLHDLGLESGPPLRRLHPQRCFHIVFDPGYWLEEDLPPWRQKLHPTWSLPAPGQPSTRLGGATAASCSSCHSEMHHLVTLDPVPDGLGVSGLASLELATCLSCLGWEQPRMFYTHSQAGKPSSIGPEGEPVRPQFPIGPLKLTQVRLAPTPPRWLWQEWGASNGRESLHRVGGASSWIQNAEYPACPQCGATMSFLMQLDSNLPLERGDDAQDEWMWGSGGIGYGFWCDACKVSGWLWQCT